MTMRVMSEILHQSKNVKIFETISKLVDSQPSGSDAPENSYSDNTVNDVLSYFPDDIDDILCLSAWQTESLFQDITNFESNL